VLDWIWNPIVMLTVVFPLLLFPTGRSLSPGWRPVTWLAVGVTAAVTVLGMLRPSIELPDTHKVANPIGVAAADTDVAPLSVVLQGLVLLLLVAAVVSLVMRFRRARGIEHQQLKWFTYAGALVLLVPLIGLVVPSLGNAAFVLVIALPIAMGIAVLRYRLYEIDRVINRTLVYGSLTAILGLGYAGAVLVLGQLFGGVTRDPPVGWWPPRRWPWRRCSSRPAAASRPRWIGASTGAATTRQEPSRRSAPACATRSTWTPWRPSCWPWSSRPWSQPGCRCGCDHR
jgi:hypothetical protein